MFQRKPIEKVCKLKNLFNSCLERIEDKDAMEELSAIVEEPPPSMWQDKKVNHINKRPKIGHELWMNA